MDGPACIICEEPGGDLRMIQEIAINKLIDSSKRRRDQKLKKWIKMTSASVHKRCSDTYIRDSAINSAAAEYSKKCIQGKNIVKNALHFDFETLCFLCGGTCNDTKQTVKMVKKKKLEIKS